MWLITLRDLQFRRRRFVIAIAATGLVFSMTLLFAGFSYTLHAEVRRIVAVIGADSWFVADGSSGPFTASTVVPETAARVAGSLGGVTRADPLVILHSTMRNPDPRDVNVIGFDQAGALGRPPVDDGRGIRGPGEVVADVELGVELGDDLLIGGLRLKVVGLARGITYYFATPTVFVTIDDAQEMSFSGQPLVTTIVTRGRPASAPPGLDLLTNADVRSDLERPLANGTQAIDMLTLLLWMTAAGIIASIIYLSALERTRDFAVLKATGSSNRALMAGLAGQAIALAVASAVVAALLAQVLVPTFPFHVEIPAIEYARLFFIAVSVGLVASVAGLRRAVGVEPALAFGGP